MDEYVCLPETHPESYHAYMWENFFKHIDILCGARLPRARDCLWPRALTLLPLLRPAPRAGQRTCTF